MPLLYVCHNEQQLLYRALFLNYMVDCISTKRAEFYWPPELHYINTKILFVPILWDTFVARTSGSESPVSPAGLLALQGVKRPLHLF